MEAVIRGVATLLVAGGVAAVCATRFPGALLVFTGAFLYGWQSHFARIGWGWLAAFALLAMAGLFLEMMASELAGDRPRLSAAGLAGMCAGAAVGGIALGPMGLACGPFAGAVAGEMFFGAGWGYARRGAAPLAGLFLALAGQVGITTMMATLYLLLVY